MKYFLSLFLFIGIVGCNNSPQKSGNINAHYGFELTKINSADLKLFNDDYGKSYLDYFQKTRDSALLYRKNRFENSVTIYDWKQKKRIKKVYFKDEGPHRISNYAQGALLPLNNKNQYFIGTVGHIYETIGDSVTHHVKSITDIQKNQNSSNTKDVFFINGQNFYPPFKHKNNVYVKTGSSIGDLGSDDYYNSSQLLKYSLQTKSFKQLDLSYPKFYYNKCWGPGRYRISYTFNPNSKKLIYLFPAKPMLYSYDLKKEIILDSFFIENKYYTKPMPISCNMPTEKQFQHIYTTPSFKKIVYDQYQDIYYMFATLPITVEEFKSVDNPFGLNPFTIFVLDNKFKVIAEKEFDGGIYFTSEFFVTEEGLWISKYNPFNENLKEDILSFDLFKLQKDENK